MLVFGLAYATIVGYSAKLARADWLRRHPDASRVETAIALDPLNAYGYTLRAELIEHAGRDSLGAWTEAAQRDPRNAEIQIRVGLAAELNQDLRAAEKNLLQAARYNQTWLPRWSLANYYFRRGDRQQTFHWAKLASERAGGDLRPLFQLMVEAGATPERVVRELLPANRNVLVSYVWFALAQPSSTGVEPAATRLAGLIPEAPREWPSLDREPVEWLFRRSYPASAAERQALLTAVDSLLARNLVPAATGLWNVLAGRGIVASGRWSPDQPIVNGQFRAAPAEGGLDWRMAKADGVDAGIWPDAGEAAITLSGRQPESVDLLTQVLCLAANRSYTFYAESLVEKLTGDTGLRWEFRDANSGAAIATPVALAAGAGWTAEQGDLAAAPEDRVVRLALTYRRPSGTVRREGVVRVRGVRMENRR